MTHIEPLFDSAQPQEAHETFCTYLAKQFIAKKGFEVAHVPELERLYDVCEIVLIRSDGYSFGVLAFVDREARPNAAFSIGVEDLEQIGQACLKYSGKVNRNQMPVSIGVIEVGSGSPEQPRRLEAFKRSGLFAKVVLFAMTVDTKSGAVWSNGAGWFSKGLYHGFVAALLAAPRQAVDLSQAAVATARPTFPVLTSAILAALCAVFAAEIAFGIGPWTKLLEPTITTLVVFGGITRDLVLQSGQWYRLLSAPFLHVDAGHLVMNGIALYLAGRSLEWLIGRAWFAAVYAVGALTGSLLSLLINPASIVAVGASGAIMGLFAAAVIISMHFPPGVIRTGLQMNSAYILIPSLLPLAGALKGQKVDYAAHFGGAMVALLILVIWSPSETLPKFRRAAAAIAIAAVVALVYPAISILQGYPAAAFTAQLIPSDKMPKTNAEMQSRAAELIQRYPHDPRPRYMRSATLLDANDLSGAEREARAALDNEELWRSALPQLGTALRVILAIAIDSDRHTEALETARPACAAMKDGPLRRLLDDRKLCSA
jgi:rhomboid protease GluP